MSRPLDHGKQSDCTYRARLVCVVHIWEVYRDRVAIFLSLHRRQRGRRASDGGDAGFCQRAGYEGFGEFAEGNVYVSALSEHEPGEGVRLEQGASSWSIPFSTEEPVLNRYLLESPRGLFLYFFSYFLFALETLFLICANWNRIIILQMDRPLSLEFP